MDLYNGQTQAAYTELSSPVRETHPVKARHLDFSLCNSNRMRSFGFRNRDGFLGPDGMTNVPRCHRDWRLGTMRKQKTRNSYLEEVHSGFLFGYSLLAFESERSL